MDRCADGWMDWFSYTRGLVLLFSTHSYSFSLLPFTIYHHHHHHRREKKKKKKRLSGQKKIMNEI